MRTHAETCSTRSGRSVVLRIVVFLIILLFVLVVASRLKSRTWHIKSDGSGDAPTVQAGVDSAAAGDTVLVAAGTYADTTHVPVSTELLAVCVHVYKTIVLMGSGPGNTTLGSPDADVVIYAEQTGPGAVIRDFKLTTYSGGYFCIDSRGAMAPSGKRGILCESSVVEVIGNEIYANDTAVHLIGSPADVADNEIHLSVRALVLEKSSDAVVRNNDLYDCARFLDGVDSSPQIVDNLMHEACDGLLFGFGCSPLISGNRITGMTNFQAIAIMSHSGATIENNWIAGVDYGIRLYEEWPDGRVVRGNTIFGTQEAVYVHPPNVLVENNTIDQTLVGIYYASGSTYIIRKNIVTRATWGIDGNGADPPVVECNDVFDTTERYRGIPDQTGVNGNIAVDPEYCGIDDSGNYYLQSDSPCAPGNHPDEYECGVIGAWKVNCGDVAVKRWSWGVIKGMFEKEANRR